MGAQAFQHVAFPQKARLDVELALPLIARLDTVAGNGPLSAHPIDVAMQAIFGFVYLLFVALDHL